MKFLLAFFILTCTCSAFCKSDYRIIGTNLFDFSKAGSIYRVRGTVSKIYPQSIQVQISGFHLVNGQTAMRLSDDPESMRIALAAYAIGINEAADGTRSIRLLTQSQYDAMDPELKQFFEPVRIFVYLINPPKVESGQAIDAFAVPTTSKDFYDYGKPFTGDPFSFQYINRVLSDRIVRERQYSPAERAALDEANRRRKDVALLTWQQQQASNGVAYSQFDLGLRYFKANGVQSNQDLAFYWIKKSAEQQYQPAIQFLNTNNPVPLSK